MESCLVSVTGSVEALAMAEENAEWLRPAVITCPGCGVRLYRVDHSPFCDDDRLYCDRCPRCVEVSWYDDVYQRIEKAVPTGRKDYELFMPVVESMLRACRCGGRFRYAAPRRCFACSAVVVEEAGVDLSPYSAWCDDRDRDATDDEQAAYDEFVKAFVVGDEPWRDDVEEQLAAIRDR